jgi:hypothetical protein
VEYRFPIADVEHGVSTLPAFLHRVSGNVFADFGGAFEKADTHHWTNQFHLGIGAELWVEMTLGYVRTANFRLGYASGLRDPNALDGGQTYVVISSAF